MRYSAKERLLAEKAIANQHLDTVASEAFLRAAEAALLDVVMAAEDTTDPSKALAGYHRIVGARDYLRALLSIAEPPQPLKPKPQYGLDRNAT